MVTDKYLTVLHHTTVEDFKKWCDQNNLPIIGIDNLPVSKQLESYELPSKCVMLFGQEGAGMSDEGVAVCGFEGCCKACRCLFGDSSCWYVFEDW